MAIIKVANTHFNVSGNTRLDYLGSNSIAFVANSGGIIVSQNAITARQTSSINLGNTSFAYSNVYLGSQKKISLGNNTTITHNTSGLVINGAPTISFSKQLVSGNGYTTNFRTPTVQYFSSNGTYSVPTGCKTIKATIIGGGGGGGGAAYTSSTCSAGGGGSSGTFGFKWLDVSSWSNTTTVTIGNGGIAGAAAGGDGGSGGTTSFGTHMSCPGGAGGEGMSGTNYPEYAYGGRTFDSSTGADIDPWAMEGGYGYRVTSAIGVSGWGGPNIFGGRAPGQASGGSGAQGYFGGGGGGGFASSTNTQGGAGGPGFVFIEEYY